MDKPTRGPVGASHPKSGPPQEAHEQDLPSLRVALINAQYDLRRKDYPVIVLLAGNDRVGVNKLLNTLHEWMDARYMDTEVFLKQRQEAIERPSYWRYWQAMPAKGRIGVFVGAWPMRALAERIREGGSAELMARRVAYMKSLERCIVDDGALLLKFWVHLPNEALEKRRKAEGKHPERKAYLRQIAWEIYEKNTAAQQEVESLLQATDTPQARWQVIAADDMASANYTVAAEILRALQSRNGSPAGSAGAVAPPTEAPKPESLRWFGASTARHTIAKPAYRERLKALQATLNTLVCEARDRFSTVLVFEGWDASGKGGVIRRITKALFAEDYRVYPIAAPTEEEKKYHYLWRFWRRLPNDGQMVIFDRSWYGRVLVERVEGFATPAAWQRAYGEINDFERQLADHGVALCKFWLQIDQEEQWRRFLKREKTPYKKYKITDEDYRNRAKWDDYLAAADEMVERTGTTGAPWHIVSANNKRWARVQVLETVVDTLRRHLADAAAQPPASGKRA